MEPTRGLRLRELRDGTAHDVDAEVLAGTAVALDVDGVAWLSFLFTPQELEALAVGFLFNEGS